MRVTFSPVDWDTSHVEYVYIYVYGKAKMRIPHKRAAMSSWQPENERNDTCDLVKYNGYT